MKKPIISEDLIFLDKSIVNQEEIIQFLIKNAKTHDYVSDSSDLFSAVMKREEEIPTAIGYDIAIPHGKTESVIHPFIAFLRTEESVRWTENKEELVRLIFLIGVPKESEGKLHLKFISQLSKKLLDDDFREELLTEKNIEKIYEQLSSINI